MDLNNQNTIKNTESKFETFLSAVKDFLNEYSCVNV